MILVGGKLGQGIDRNRALGVVEGCNGKDLYEVSCAHKNSNGGEVYHTAKQMPPIQQFTNLHSLHEIQQDQSTLPFLLLSPLLCQEHRH